jgi:hypothetical protein
VEDRGCYFGGGGGGGGIGEEGTRFAKGTFGYKLYIRYEKGIYSTHSVIDLSGGSKALVPVPDAIPTCRRYFSDWAISWLVSNNKSIFRVLSL